MHYLAKGVQKLPERVHCIKIRVLCHLKKFIDTLSMNSFFCSLNDVLTLFADFGRKISKAEFGHI